MGVKYVVKEDKHYEIYTEFSNKAKWKGNMHIILLFLYEGKEEDKMRSWEGLWIWGNALCKIFIQKRQKYMTPKRKNCLCNVIREKHNIKWYIHNKSSHVKLCIRTWVRREHGKLKAIIYICSIFFFYDFLYDVLCNIKKRITAL